MVKVRHIALDCGDQQGLGFGQVVARQRHEPGDGSRQGRAGKRALIGLFGQPSAPRPVRDDADLSAETLLSPVAHDTQQSIVAHRHHEAIGKGRSRPAAKREPQVMNDRLKTSGPSR